MRSLQRNVCAILVAVLAGTHTAGAADKWLSVRSKNFLLVGNASESSIKRVGRELEEFRAGLANLFPSVNQESPVGTTVIVFKDDASFRPYKPLYEGKAGNVAGYFQAGEDVNFIALAADTRSPHVVYHEFVHSLTKDTSLPLPPWASEGFAEVYGMFELSGRDMILGRAIGEHVFLLKQQTMMPLRQLFSIERGSPYYNEKTKQGMFYAESWASVHYLMFGNNGKRRRQLSKYLNLVSNGKSLEDNFHEAFEMDFETLEEEIRRYVQQQVAWPAIKIKLPERLNFDREMQVSTLSEAQAQYYLGDLLLHMNRLDAAEPQLRKAIALDPKFSPSYASLGLLKIRQSDHAEAVQHLAKAVEQDSKNHLAHYYYAFMLQKMADRGSSEEQQSQWSLMRTHIQKTIEISPRFPEAYNMLGYIALMSKEGTVEAEAEVTKGIQYAPGRLELRLRLAELMAANGKLTPAQSLATALVNSNADEIIRYQAERVLDNIRGRIEFEKNRQEYERQLREYEERRREAQEAAVRTPGGDVTVDVARVDEAPRLTRRSETPAPGTTTTGVIETAGPQLQTPQGLRVEGLLTHVDCSAGLTLRVRVGNTTVELHTDKPAEIEFMSYVTTVSDTIACGVMKPEVAVAIVYRRSPDRRFFGEPVRVDFVNPN